MQHRPVSGTVKMPALNFTGDVYLNSIATADETSRLAVSLVRFTPGARTNWHSHAKGQLLVCIDGAGLVASRNGTVLCLEAGQTVWTPPGEEHWHGGRADQMMCHYAILNETDVADVADATTWLEPVSTDQYTAASANVSR